MKTNSQMNNTDISKYLRVSLRTLYTLMRSGEIPSQKIKGSRVFFLSEVNNALLKDRAYLFDLDKPLVLLIRHEAAHFLGRTYWSLAHERDPARKVENPVPFVMVGDQFRYIETELQAHKQNVDTKHAFKAKDLVAYAAPNSHSASEVSHEP